MIFLFFLSCLSMNFGKFWQTSDIKFGNTDHYPYRHHWQLIYIQILIIPFKVAFNLMMLEFLVKFTIGVNEFFVSMLISMVNCEKICTEWPMLMET